MEYLLVFGGGGFGALCRWLATSFFAMRFGAAFPYGTLFVNLTGSFLMGLVMGLLPLLPRGALLPENLRLLLAVGFLGGFTTFSSFSMETLALLQGAHALSALLNVLANVILGMAAAWAGLLLVRTVL